MWLDDTRRPTMLALADPNRFHGAVETAFPGPKEGRNLWRIDRIGGRQCLLLLSPTAPDLTNAALQFGDELSGQQWETKDYTPLLERAKDGTQWSFRLTANPTMCLSGQKEGPRGGVRAHNTVAYQQKWLLDRAGTHGFALEEDGFRVTERRWFSFWKGQKKRVSLLSVTFEGLLTVTYEELFRKTLVQGIGRGKAYGMGLLTIVRPAGE